MRETLEAMIAHDIGCGGLALLSLLLGVGVGVVLTYVRFSFHVAELRRKIEKLQGRG